jgi:hypothetical protein
VIYAITINDAPAERHRYDSAHEALHEKVCEQNVPMMCEMLFRFTDADHAVGYIFRFGEEKPYVSAAPHKTAYSKHLARYTWNEYVQSDAGRTIVVRGAALVCPGGYVTPSDFKPDPEVPK